MSGGAWTQVVANHPQVEKVTVIEINPGYFRVIRRYPDVAPLLRNPKVTIFIDDGRRWMIRNRGRKFDAILMDTIGHWRAQATNLLSVEFLQLARQMLKPGGVLFYNTTYSADAQLTGATLFPYVLRFGPFLTASDSPLELDKTRWRNTLLAYRLEGKPILDPADPDDRDRLNEVLGCVDKQDPTGLEYLGVEAAESVRRRTRGSRIVTDDNMATEWAQ
jgi:SAM-dependent methyltransferase